MRRWSSTSALVLAWFLAGACRTPPGGLADAGQTEEDAGRSYPAPRTDLVPSAGTDATFEIATWNIENFPKSTATPAVLADLIASLDLDMVAIQEVEDIGAFNELVERLEGYEGRLSSHTYGNGNYQKLGYIFRSSLIDVSGEFLLFSQEGYVFPRPPFKVDVSVNGERPFQFTSVALHLKAGFDFDDRQRREEAVVILEDYLRTTMDSESNPSLIVLGDFNDRLESGAEVFSPLLAAADRYTIETLENDDAGEISFVPIGSLIDHVVTTNNFGDRLADAETLIPRLDMQMTGYVAQVSDHLPVILRVPL